MVMANPDGQLSSIGQAWFEQKKLSSIVINCHNTISKSNRHTIGRCDGMARLHADIELKQS